MYNIQYAHFHNMFIVYTNDVVIIATLHEQFRDMYTVRRVLISYSRLGQLDVVKYLIQRVNDINIKNNDGLTPLHYACL